MGFATVGLCLLFGGGVDEDIAEGMFLLGKAIELGCDFACYLIGDLYLKGNILPQNTSKAKYYLEKVENNCKEPRFLQDLGRQKVKDSIKMIEEEQNFRARLPLPEPQFALHTKPRSFTTN